MNQYNRILVTGEVTLDINFMMYIDPDSGESPKSFMGKLDKEFKEYLQGKAERDFDLSNISMRFLKNIEK